MNFTWADEGGNSFWYCGQFASLVAVPRRSGWMIDAKVYYFDEKNTSLNKIYSGEIQPQNLTSQTGLLFLEPSFTPDTKWFGGQPSFTLAQGYGHSFSTANFTITNSGENLSLSQNIWGLSNMYPFVEIAWNKENNNWLTYLMGGIPIGNFNPLNLSNLGTGHYALDLGAAFTYLNKVSGWEGSALLGFTYNFINPQTDYQNGIDSHLDYAISNFLSTDWELGVVGYVYYQLTADKGKLGTFKSRAAALGAEGTHFWKSGEYEMNFNLRGYYDFWTENRLGGFSMYAIFTVQFPN